MGHGQSYNFTMEKKSSEKKFIQLERVLLKLTESKSESVVSVVIVSQVNNSVLWFWKEKSWHTDDSLTLITNTNITVGAVLKV